METKGPKTAKKPQCAPKLPFQGFPTRKKKDLSPLGLFSSTKVLKLTENFLKRFPSLKFQLACLLPFLRGQREWTVGSKELLNSYLHSLRAVLTCCHVLVQGCCFLPKVSLWRPIRLVPSPRQKRFGYEKKRPRPESVDESVLGPDLEAMTGISADHLEQLFTWMKPRLATPRRRALTPKARLCMLLYWFKAYPNWENVGATFHISREAARKQCLGLLPLLLEACKAICPIVFEPETPSWADYTPASVSVAVDATSHPKRREGATNQERMLNYRTDKGFIVGAELVVSVLDVRLLSVKIVAGHNNDPGTYKYFGTRELLQGRNVAGTFLTL